MNLIRILIFTYTTKNDKLIYIVSIIYTLSYSIASIYKWQSWQNDKESENRWRVSPDQRPTDDFVSYFI